MTSTLAIDSGSPECAVAATRKRALFYVATVTLEWLPPCSFDRVAVEIPACRPDTPNPNDLLAIAVVGARLAERAAGRIGTITEYRPQDWKGNTPKPPHHARLWLELTPAERALLGGTKTAAAIDAACTRGAHDRWRKSGATYYRARELPTVGGVGKITHDMLDAAALALYDLGRIGRG